MQVSLPADVVDALVRHGLSPGAILLEPSIPLSTFRAPTGILEATAQHLLSTGMSATQIAALLNRSPTTIRNSARAARSCGLVPGNPDVADASTQIYIPTSVLADRSRPPLAALVRFLREERGWRFVAIARALGRDPRSVSAAYRRGVA